MSKFVEIPVNKISIRNRKKILEVGINDADYKTTIVIDGKKIKCKIYYRWIRILERCYSEKRHEKYPTYRDCSMCDEWLTFSNFKKWMEIQNYHDLEIDKDLKVPNNKVYSPENCLLVSRKINKLITNIKSKRNGYLVGVTFVKDKGKFRAFFNDNGKTTHIGYFCSEIEGHNAWRKRKKEVMLEIVELPEYKYIKEYLINYINSL